jgi:hypothetical protein
MLTTADAEARRAVLGPVQKLGGPPRTSTQKVIIGLLGVVGVLLVVGYLGGAGERAQRAQATPQSAWNPPAGFRVYEDGLGWKFLEKTEYRCAMTTIPCVGGAVYARDGCPNNLYVELSVIDSAGSAIGYTNDAVGAIGPGQTAKLTFNITEDDASDVRLTQISCY